MSMTGRCYIVSASQVSSQKPLDDSWRDEPLRYDAKYVRSQEPDVREYVSAGEARRMCRLLRRVVATSLTALADAGIEVPDAVVTGTGMGCMENSEKFLTDLCVNGESLLKPTLFMQSTHNTIGSLIGILLKAHGYNTTYSNGSLSFVSALLDAWLLLREGTVENALVGAHDETTLIMAEAMTMHNPVASFMSETSVSMVLSAVPHACGDPEIIRVELRDGLPSEYVAETIDKDKPGIVVAGCGGYLAHEPFYEELLRLVPEDVAVVEYKHIFGENFSSPAMGLYVGYSIMRYGTVPPFMIRRGKAPAKPDSVMVITPDSMVTLKRNGSCGG